MVNSILVVDDSLAERQHLQSILSDSGYNVFTASDGSQVIEAVKTNHIQLVLMDVNMPVMDGFAATRALKNDAETKDTPVVFITAKNQKADKAWGQILGAKGYITKPYTDEQILNQLSQIH